MGPRFRDTGTSDKAQNLLLKGSDRDRDTERGTEDRSRDRKSRQDMWDDPGSEAAGGKKGASGLTAAEQRAMFEKERLDILSQRRVKEARPVGESSAYHRECDDMLRQMQDEQPDAFSGSPEPSDASPNDFGGGLLHGGGGPSQFSALRSLTAADVMRSDSSEAGMSSAAAAMSSSRSSKLFPGVNDELDEVLSAPFSLPLASPNSDGLIGGPSLGLLGFPSSTPGIGMGMGIGIGGLFPTDSVYSGGSGDLGLGLGLGFDLTLDGDRQQNTWLSQILDADLDLGVGPSLSVDSLLGGVSQNNVEVGIEDTASAVSEPVVAVAVPHRALSQESVNSASSNLSVSVQKSSRLSALLGLGLGLRGDEKRATTTEAPAYSSPASSPVSVRSSEAFPAERVGSGDQAGPQTSTVAAAGSAGPRSISVNSLFSVARQHSGGVVQESTHGGSKPLPTATHPTRGHVGNAPTQRPFVGVYSTQDGRRNGNSNSSSSSSGVGGSGPGPSQSSSSTRPANISAASRMQIMRMQQQSRRSLEQEQGKGRVQVGAGTAVEPRTTPPSSSDGPHEKALNSSSKPLVVSEPIHEFASSSSSSPAMAPVAQGGMQRLSLGVLFAKATVGGGASVEPLAEGAVSLRDIEGQK